MAEELIYKVGVEGTNELNKLEQSVDKAGKTTNKTTDYFQKMRMELRAARGDMLKYAEGTREYNKALNKAADIQGRMKDTNDKVRASTQDLGDTTKNVTGAMVGFAGGFQVVQSAMSLFGIENEETIKTILKLQQTMAIVQGMSAFANSIDNMQDLIAGFRASNQQLNEDLKTTSDGMEGVSKSTGKMGDSMGSAVKDSAVLGSNLAGNTKIAGDLDKVNKNLGKQIAETGKKTVSTYTGIAESVNNFTIGELQRGKAMLESGGATEELNYATRTLLATTDESITTNEQRINLINREIALIREKTQALRESMGTEQLSDGKSRQFTREVTETTEKATESTSKFGKAKEKIIKTNEKAKTSFGKLGSGISKFTKSILKSLGTMAVFLAAIWAVTAAISWMVKKLAEVPEDVKIKLELETNALNSYIASLNKIKNFVREYNQALKDGNEKYLKQLDEKAKKEFRKNQADLDAIKKRGKMTEDFFTAYLQMAKDTYFNEALAKLKSEKEVALLIAKEEEKSAQKLKDQRREENKGESGFITLGRWIFTKDQVKKARKEGEKVQKELDALNKIEYKPVKSPFIEDEIIIPPTTKTAPGDAPTLQERKPDSVEDDMEIELMGERLLAKRGLSHQERELEAENARFTDENQSDSYLRYAEHQQRMAIARDKDLGERKNALEESLAKEEEFYQTQLANQNENLKAVADGHNAELEKLKQFNQIKFDIEEEVSAMIKRRQGLDGKTDADEIARIDAKIKAKKELYDENDNLIEQSKKEIQTYKDRAKAIEEELKALDASPEKIKLLKDELVDLNLAITDSNRAVAMSIAEVRNAQLDSAKQYTEQMGTIFFDLQNITNAMMQAEDNKLAKEKNNLELSQAYREADSEQQQQMMYELELANYEAKKKAFEVDKAFQIGAVVTQSASNQIDIIKAWLDPKTGGPLSPANIAVAAAATAANVATTVASIKQISSTSLEKPVPPSGGGASGGAGAPNIALNPNKTALTSKEENLNSMYKSGNMDGKDTIVKVSEINNVQKRVKVREKNSSY